MAGGFRAWSEAGLPVAAEKQEGGRDPLHRYGRHLTLKQVGREGQMKLLRGKVLLVGAGGLGSPAALYLAAAGVGTLGLIDADVVDETNLQRQILHAWYNVGRPKVDSARETLFRVNPEIKVETYAERLTAANARRILEPYDVIVDGADNFPTRYLINDAAYLLGKPVAHGSIFQFEGQATTIWPKQGGPCYRCLYPAPPPAQFAPN